MKSQIDIGHNSALVEQTSIMEFLIVKYAYWGFSSFSLSLSVSYLFVSLQKAHEVIVVRYSNFIPSSKSTKSLSLYKWSGIRNAFIHAKDELTHWDVTSLHTNLLWEYHTYTNQTMLWIYEWIGGYFLLM